MGDKNVTRNNKSSVFAGYFNDAKRLIELYNAIEGTTYSQDTQLEINTLEDVLFRYQINDISFTLDGKLIVLIESQSTINENMPLRLLMYIGRIYEKLIDKKSIYRRALIKLPKPEFIVLYNGEDEFPEQKMLRLTDAFADVVTKELLELTVTVYNVNSGYNTEMLRHCKPLGDYSQFFARIRSNTHKGMDFDDAVIESIDYCIKHGIMADYLEIHSSEVRNMLYTEYNFEDDLQVRFEEGLEEGKAEGKAEERAKSERKIKAAEVKAKAEKLQIAKNLTAINLSTTDIAKLTGLSIQEVEGLTQDTLHSRC